MRTPDVAVVQRVITVPPERVFAVLADGWAYSDWVVGAVHIRGVDPGWPEPGTKIYYRAGAWPLSLSDRTVVVESRPPSLLILRPRLWPIGELTVHLELAPVGTDATRVTMAEDFADGPMRWLQTRMHGLAMPRRNREALRRLADLAERRSSGPHR